EIIMLVYNRCETEKEKRMEKVIEI
ncbi:MAG: hypothetical protein F083_3183, partial [bacterium F083]